MRRLRKVVTNQLKIILVKLQTGIEKDFNYCKIKGAARYEFLETADST